MEFLEIEQGSEEWLEARKKYRNASEAPAALGVSKYMSRDELLYQKKTGKAKEVSDFQQRIFDSGHHAEAEACFLAEMEAGCTFLPKVGIEGEYLASFDGISKDGSVVWEHKLFNGGLAAQVAAGNLEPHYWAQLEHQLYVSGAERAFFMASDGTLDNCRHCWYESVPERREQLLAGWDLFYQDLESFDAEAFETVNREDEEWTTTAQELSALNAQIKELQGQEKALKAKLVEMAAGRKTVGGGVTVYPTKRQTVDYKSALADAGIDAEPYKKESTSWTVRVG